ncbi:MAG: radical SAM protein [Candidatus Omnitrophica bacterium]|nr:radical SAM protein [Candidatus Omnitrophota bacterium]
MMWIKSNYQKFRKHFKDKGFFYALWRGIKYFVYLIKKYKGEKKLHFKKKTLKKGGTEVVCFDKNIKIFWKEKEITKDVGLNTSLIIKGNCFTSPKAKWKVKIIDTDILSILVIWKKIPIRQDWLIKLVSPDKIVWLVDIEIKKDISFEERKASIMVSSLYKRWINSYEEGFFPVIRNWEEIPLQLKESKFIGVRTFENDLLNIIFDYAKNYFKTSPSLQNTGKENNARVLNACMGKEDYKKGKYPYFRGEILLIKDEQILENYIEKARGEFTKKIFLNKKDDFKVVLVNLPWQRDGKWGVRAGSRWPHIKTEEENNYQPFPFFLAYSASLLKNNGFEVYLIDCLAEKIDFIKLKQKIKEIKPQLLLAETSTPSLYNDLEILEQLSGNFPIALSGPEANIRKKEFLERNPFIDFVLVGEYEVTLLELVKSIKENLSFQNILGLIYRSDGEVKINPPRPLIKDLDSLPWPLREGLPMESYIDAPGEMPLPSVQMWSSRGCIFKCLFCLWPSLMYQGNIFRTRNPLKVVEEMEYLVKEMGFRSIYFDDDTFNIGKERVLEICRQIRKYKLNIPWAIMARPDLMDKEMLSALKEAGVWAIKYGVESGEQKLLDKIGKNMNLQKAIEMIRLTKKLGIKFHLTFMFGLPGETMGSIKETIELAIDLAPFSLQFSLVTPFPGTSLFEYCKDSEEIASYDWEAYDGNYNCVINTEALTSKEIENFKNLALQIWRDYQKGILSYAEACKILPKT